MSRVNIEGGRVTGIDRLETIEGSKTVLRGQVDGLNALPTRYELKWVAGEQGKPGINADLDSTDEAVRVATDRSFELGGVSKTSALCTQNAEGGIRLTTGGIDGNEMILVPHEDTAQTAWDDTTWGTDQGTVWECHIRTADAALSGGVTNTIIWAGLKLTSAEAVATDADQVYFRYEDDVNGGRWQFVYSIANTDVTIDTGVLGQPVVAIDENFHLKIVIDNDRIARGYINGVLVGTTTALTDAIDLKPYIGVADDGSTRGAFINIYGQSISRLAA